MTAPGAAPDEWDHFSLVLGLTHDLLPVVSNPHATISPQSKMKSIGKTPSKYNSRAQVVGIPQWTQHRATLADIDNWRSEPDYGICIQTRAVRALDCDIDNEQLAKDIHDEINRFLSQMLPARKRATSARLLLVFTLPGENAKRTIQTDHGIIEFLATGQQFIAAGTHPSGARYEWVGGLPDEIPELRPDVFEKLWRRLEECFAAAGTTSSTASTSTRAATLAGAAQNDPTAIRLSTDGAVRSTNRDGSLNIVCPFAAEHTSDTDESATTYFPAFTGGFERGHFHCLHAHCAGRSDAEFLAALNINIAESDFEIISDTPIEGTGEKTERFTFSTLEEFSKRASPEWIVKHVIPRATLAVIFGDSGSGKTFFALDIGLAIATGGDWRSHKVKQSRVGYIAAEDATGVGQRVRAYFREREATPGGIPFFPMDAAPDFLKKEDVKGILKAINAVGGLDVIFVDTWAQVTAGANENSGEDMGTALAYCRSLHHATGALIVLIHHSGKDASKGARGWSGLRAAADCQIEVTRDNDDRVATIDKLKGWADGAQFGFKLKPVMLGVDDDGDDITSCVLEHNSQRKKERSRKDTAVETVTLNVLDERSVGGPVKDTDLIEWVVSNMAAPEPGKRDQRSRDVQRAITTLIARNKIQRSEDGLISRKENE